MSAIDFSLDNRIMLDNRLDCAIQELDMLFNTTNTELIGDTNYGTNFEQFLWQLTPSPSELKRYINEKIQQYTYYMLQYDYDINIKTELGELRDIYYVEITLTTDSDDEETEMKSHRVYMLA